MERIQAWGEVYGGPPSARDWNPAQAVIRGRPDISARFYADGCWPHVNSARRAFGSWNAAIEAAGFTPRLPGKRGAAIPPVRPLLQESA